MPRVPALVTFRFSLGFRSRVLFGPLLGFLRGTISPSSPSVSHMNRSRASRGTALALSLVPGWGHIYLGEELKGLTIFTLAAISAFAWINASWMYLASFRPVLLTLGILGFIGLWVWSTVEVFVKTRPERVGRLRRRCDHLLWEGILHFLSRDDLAAEEDFVECARIDCLDVEAHFRSGVAAARRGERELARRRLERARRLDVDARIPVADHPPSELLPTVSLRHRARPRLPLPRAPASPARR